MLPMESQPRLLNLSPRGVEKEYLLDMSPSPTKRVAIYARVSTFDKGQDPETQLLQLREYVGRRGFDVKHSGCWQRPGGFPLRSALTGIGSSSSWNLSTP